MQLHALICTEKQLQLQLSNCALARRQIAPPTWTSEVNCTTCVQTHGSICTAPERLFSKTARVTRFVYIAVVLGQPAGVSEERWLLAGADWLSSSVIQRVARGQLWRRPPIIVLVPEASEQRWLRGTFCTCVKLQVAAEVESSGTGDGEACLSVVPSVITNDRDAEAKELSRSGSGGIL